MNEVWNKITDYPEYEVSSFGNIRSLRFNKVKTLKLNINSKGYFVVGLNKKGKQKMFYVHFLVAQAFLNHKSNGFTVVVDHKDNNKLNNVVDNLQLVSNRINTSKDRKRNLPTGVFKTRHGNYQVFIRIKGKLKTFGTYKTVEEAVKIRNEQLLTL